MKFYRENFRNNANFIAKRCNNIGITVGEIIIIPDLEKVIISTIINFSKKYQYVFVTGGIGPTRDITAQSVAIAFNRRLIVNKTAKNLLVIITAKERKI